MGAMVVVAEDLASSLPLENTEVTAQVLGPLASVSVTQRFGNPLHELAEIDYLFPLPHQAAVVHFELRIGERRIEGDLQELEQARAAYAEALQEGRRAGLLEERRPNLFSVRIGNVLRGEHILATMRYQARLGYDDGDYEFVFPMGITPKFHDSEHPGEGLGTSAPLAGTDEPIGPVEITVSVDAGTAAGEPSSPSHPIEMTRLDARRFTVQLAGHQIPDQDFVLRYPVAREALAAAAWTAAGEDGDYFMATLLPPAMDEEASPPPREFVFVLDRSGSMSGQPIEQARNALRACLRTLNPEDVFRILLFDNRLEWFRPEPSGVTQEEIDAADAYLAAVNSRGGTRIVGALKEALGLAADPQRSRYLVFLTDGAVSAEARALDEVRRTIGDARLFTFGIGPSVNRALLAQLARLGRGTAEFLGLDEDIEGAIIRFQDRVSFPVVSKLKMRWKNGKTWDVHPVQLPDLYVGRPLEIVGRLKRTGAGPTELLVSGTADGPVEMKLILPAESDQEPAVVRAWARARVDDLLETAAMGGREAHKLRAEIIGLALEHKLVTPYTAFVALDSEVATEGGRARPIRVAQPLPQGLDLAGFTGELMSIRMPAAAHMLRAAAPAPASPVAAAKSFTLSLGATMARERPERKRLRQKQKPVRERPEDTLRWLARTQNVNGSWQDDVEMTAAALIVLVRAGHTTRQGHYRTGVKRAFDFLVASHASRTATFFRAVALAELAAATGASAHREAAEGAIKNLKPGNELERLALARATAPSQVPTGAPDAIRDLNDLRMAAVSRARCEIPDRLFGGRKGELARVWAACLPEA
jgi:Ca-activated chloride channel family protein